MYLHNATQPAATTEAQIESGDYLFTGGLLRGAARTAAFPVSACLPSAGGGVFKTTHTNPQQKAVFVKTSRDANDGSTWNAGILREDPKLKLAREWRGANRAGIKTNASGSNSSSRSSKCNGSPRGSVSTGSMSEVLRSRLASVYRKQHLEDMLGSMEINEQMEKELAIEEAIAAAEEEKRVSMRAREGSRPPEKVPFTSTTSKTEIYQQLQTRQQNQLGPQVSPHRVAARERGISLVAPDHVLLRTRDFTQALLNESCASSSELLSSLTGVSPANGAQVSQPYKSITSLGNGLPPPRPDSSQRGWENVKATLFEKSNRRTSWADLNRDTEYLKKYDVNAIPGLEVQVGTIRCQRRPKAEF
ncbi:hypothetical protein BDR26DRAFT_527904 [Obelidium mucronatum]|nr:hypothetical protein BDR26DRAFT_527904 [Obelidium mucronatum]